LRPPTEGTSTVSSAGTWAASAAPWLIGSLAFYKKEGTLLAGMFLGATEWMLISVPVFSPIIDAVGFDPIWFWTLYLINVVTGGMTPPFGMTMFVFKAAVPGSNMIDIYNSTWPFVGVIFLGIGIMWLFPQIVLILPQLMG